MLPDHTCLFLHRLSTCCSRVMYRALILIMAIWGVEGCSDSESCSTEPPNSTREYCYSARIRSTVLQGLPFGGVPTVLALDFMCFLVSNCLANVPSCPVIRADAYIFVPFLKISYDALDTALNQNWGEILPGMCDD